MAQHVSITLHNLKLFPFYDILCYFTLANSHSPKSKTTILKFLSRFYLGGTVVTLIKILLPCLSQSLRLRILLVCLHIIVILIIITYSEWTAVAARGQPPVRAEPWPAVLVHATRLVRNLSSAGTRARQELRDEKDLIDCLVWIVRVGVKSEQYDNKVRY